MNPKSAYGILLNWNGLEHLKYCIPSLLKTRYPGFRLVLVDNGSKDGSVEYVKKRFREKLEIIELDRNYGYSHGMNTGIEYALKRKADFIATINSDIMVDPRWVDEGILIMSENADVGVVGYDLLGMEIRGNVKRFLREKKRRKTFTFKRKSYVLDALMLVRGGVFRNVGGFDEKYITYGEEEDLFKRIQIAGYSLAECTVPTYHYGHGTADKIPLRAGYLMMRNSIRYGIKWLSFWELTKRILYIMHVAMNPFARIDKRNLVVTKLRPSNVFVNALLVARAIGWNLVFLPQTLLIKRRELKGAEKAHRHSQSI